jgi:hypothetical protein
MALRSGPIAPALGVLLILLGIAFFGFYVRGNAPMEEPASPGKTPNPSQVPQETWGRRHPGLIPRLHRFSIPAGVVFVGVGIVLLLPLDSRRDAARDGT